MHRRNPGRASGFTLVEAIVALVVLSMSLMATYGWIQVSVEMLIKTDEVTNQEIGLDQLVGNLQSIDFAKQSAGEYDYGELSFSWIAKPYEKERPGRNVLGRKGAYDHTLYVVSIVVFRGVSRVANYRVRLVDSVLVRPPEFRFGSR